MKNRIVKLIFISVLCTQNSFSQNNNNTPNVNTQEVTVNSTYKATVDDAFKINSNPIKDDAILTTRKKVNYNIYTFPVESTFKPSKGSFVGLDAYKEPNFFSNYASLSVGNYKRLRTKLGIVENISKDMYLGGKASFTRVDGVKEFTTTDDGSQNANLEVMLGSDSQTSDWKITVGTDYNKHSWYVVPSSELEIKEIPHDLNRTAQTVFADYKLNLYDQVLQSIDVNYSYFWDNYTTNEHQFQFAPKVSFFIDKKLVNIDIKTDYVVSNLVNTKTSLANLINNEQFAFTVEPSTLFKYNDLNIKVGLGINYFFDQNDKSDKNPEVSLYPKINIDAPLVNDIINAYGGVQGGVQTNSYSNLYRQNPYLGLSPNLKITDIPLDFYAGLRGKIYHNFSYNIKSNFKNEINKHIYVLNERPLVNTNFNEIKPYNYANTFDVAYENVKTFTTLGELSYDLNKFHISVFGEYNKYFVADKVEVYNLPNIRLGLNSVVNITPQLSAFTQLTYVGERKGKSQSFYSSTSEKVAKTLNDYVNLALNLNYQITDNWSAFINTDNLLNQKYDLYTNYVQRGIEISAGVKYKF